MSFEARSDTSQTLTRVMLQHQHVAQGRKPLCRFCFQQRVTNLCPNWPRCK